MKSLILIAGFVVLTFTTAHAKVSVPDGRYTFSLTKEHGPARKLQISFHSEERNQKDTLVADIEATLEDGKIINGQIACESKSQGSEIICERKDDGGGFKLLKSKIISGNSFKYTLKISQLALSEEGEEELIEIKAKDENPFEVTGTK